MQLTNACKDALSTSPEIDASRLTCNVRDGVAYVSGTVYTEDQRELVVEILKGVEGIIDVRATLEIEDAGETNPVMLWF
jgi:osmotically-inducible protein OsmY